MFTLVSFFSENIFMSNCVNTIDICFSFYNQDGVNVSGVKQNGVLVQQMLNDVRYEKTYIELNNKIYNVLFEIFLVLEN